MTTLEKIAQITEAIVELQAQLAALKATTKKGRP